MISKVKIHYINLTAGLFWYSELIKKNITPQFIRIKSTYLEQKLFDDLFFSLSDDFLFHLAIGNEVILYEASSNSCPKLKKLGIPIIKGILENYWFGKNSFPNYFDRDFIKRIFNSLSKKTKNKIKYFKKFIELNDKCCINLKLNYKYIKKEKDFEIIKSFINYEKVV